MKVFVVHEPWYSSDEVYGAFSTVELASEWIGAQTNPSIYEVAVFEVDALSSEDATRPTGDGQ